VIEELAPRHVLQRPRRRFDHLHGNSQAGLTDIRWPAAYGCGKRATRPTLSTETGPTTAARSPVLNATVSDSNATVSDSTVYNTVVMPAVPRSRA